MLPIAEREGVKASGHHVESPSSGILFSEFDETEGVEIECIWVNCFIHVHFLRRDSEKCSARNSSAVGEGVVMKRESLHSDWGGVNILSTPNPQLGLRISRGCNL